MSVGVSSITTAPVVDLHLANSSRRIPELDGLRGLAILMVVSLHYTMFTGRGPEHTVFAKLVRGFGFGWAGVDLFFVLSGFLIGGILLEAKNSDRYFKTFYARRIYRIFPLYYFWLLLYLVFLLGGIVLAKWPQMFRVEDLLRFPRYLFFLQNLFSQNSGVELTWLAPTRSLAVEEQ